MQNIQVPETSLQYIKRKTDALLYKYYMRLNQNRKGDGFKVPSKIRKGNRCSKPSIELSMKAKEDCRFNATGLLSKKIAFAVAKKREWSWGANDMATDCTTLANQSN